MHLFLRSETTNMLFASAENGEPNEPEMGKGIRATISIDELTISQQPKPNNTP